MRLASCPRCFWKEGRRKVQSSRKSWWLRLQSPYVETGMTSHKNGCLLAFCIFHQETVHLALLCHTPTAAPHLSITGPSPCSPDHALCTQPAKPQTPGRLHLPLPSESPIIQQISGRQGVLSFALNAFVYSSLGRSGIEWRQQISTVALRQQSSKWRTQFLFLPSVTLWSQVPWIGCSICGVRAVIRLQSAPCNSAQPAFEVFALLFLQFFVLGCMKCRHAVFVSAFLPLAVSRFSFPII